MSDPPDPVGVEGTDFGGGEINHDGVTCRHDLRGGRADGQDRADIGGAEPTEPCRPL